MHRRNVLRLLTLAAAVVPNLALAENDTPTIKYVIGSKFKPQWKLERELNLPTIGVEDIQTYSSSLLNDGKMGRFHALNTYLRDDITQQVKHDFDTFISRLWKSQRTLFYELESLTQDIRQKRITQTKIERRVGSEPIRYQRNERDIRVVIDYDSSLEKLTYVDITSSRDQMNEDRDPPGDRLIIEPYNGTLQVEFYTYVGTHVLLKRRGEEREGDIKATIETNTPIIDVTGGIVTDLENAITLYTK